jgi:hypothetical protein
MAHRYQPVRQNGLYKGKAMDKKKKKRINKIK